MEFSKTVRFDFPRIPIVGTLGLIIILLSFKNVSSYLYGTDNQLSLGLLSAIIVCLGTAGITTAQLVSMVFFDLLFPIKKLVSSPNGYKTSYEWFSHIQQEAKPKIRERDTISLHSIDNRQDIKKLNHKQIHATLHALEMECREKSPPFGVQLEYYYSLYIFFFVSAIFSAVIILISFLSGRLSLDLEFTDVIYYANFSILIFGFFGSIRARRMKEYLRITLFNHDRKFVLELLGRWYQCYFYYENQRLKEPG